MRKFGSAALAAALGAGVLAVAAPAQAAEYTSIKHDVALGSVTYNGKTYRAKATQSFSIRTGGAKPAGGIRNYELDLRYNVPTGFSVKVTEGKPAVSVEKCTVAAAPKWACTVVRTKVDARVVASNGKVYKRSVVITTEVTRKGVSATWVA